MRRYRMDVVMVIPGMAFSGGSLKRHSLGGSETAAIAMARELQKLGNTVHVFCDCDKPHTGGPGEYDGVLYKPLGQAEGWIASCDHDVLIAQRNPLAFAIRSRSKLNVLWNHDLAVKINRQGLHSSLWNIDYITGLSKFHVDQQVEVLKLDGFKDKDLMWQTRNGIDLKEFSFDINNKKPKQLIFSSRPERGLENLVKPGGIMEKLHKIDPEIHLIVAGYDHTVDQMRRYYEMLWARVKELPNCSLAGSLPKHRLYKLMAESSVYVCPSDFEEISFITAMEVMRSKTVLISTDCGATRETVGDCALLLQGPTSTEEYQERFINSVVGIINDYDRRNQIIEAGYKRTENMGWSDVAKEWEEKFSTFFENQVANKGRLKKHFLYYEDTIAAVKLTEEEEILTNKKDIFKTRVGMIENPELFNDNHFALHGPEIENMSDCMSYAHPLKRAFISAFMKDDIKSVLDFGCDIGQYTYSLAKDFPNKRFIGMDISGVKINLLNKLPLISNAPFIKGNEEDKLSQSVDCIIANEVIEYQKEPWAFVDKIERNVKEGGRVLICTANGPWAKAAKNNITYRLWNFDRQDIRDMFGKKKGYAINTASAGDVEATGEALGWFFISYIKDSNIKTNEINMERKLHIQRPRQTLALSMIVKNAEDMLHRTLKSVEDLVDEIIVIDTGSEDSTKEIARKYTDKVYDGSDPLVEGFETPRNETLKHITSDWILWIDSDEVLLRGENLRKYLRDNIYNGYSIKQHHFSAVPPNIFIPDLPIRVFRTDRGIKWYGVVHEHVEIELNESVKVSNLISDVDIGHDGYLTEGIRRKRFDRNYKLILRDREKYPERRLGKFLKTRDDIHVIRYTLEKNNRVLTTDLVKTCEGVVESIRKDFLGKDDHFQMDALGFYSEALRILNRGFEIRWCIAAAKKNPEVKPQDIVTYQFANKSDVDIFFTSKFKNMFELFTGKYCGQ